MNNLLVDDVPEADHELMSLSLANLAIKDEYKEKGTRVFLQFFQELETTTVTPASSVSYHDASSNLEPKPKPELDSTSTMNIVSVIQTVLDIKCSIKVHFQNAKARRSPLLCDLKCDLYYDGMSNNLIMLNRSLIPIEIQPVSIENLIKRNSSLIPNEIQPISDCKSALSPKGVKDLIPGMYKLIMYGRRIMNLMVLAKNDVPETTRTLTRSGNQESDHPKSLKRPLPATQGLSEESQKAPNRQIRKVGHPVDRSSIAFPTTYALGTSSKKTQLSTGNPFIELPQHGVLDVPGVLGVEAYQIHKRSILYEGTHSEVYLAQHTGMSHDEIVVKVLKIKRREIPAKNRMTKIGNAEAWLREYNVHNRLNHQSIVAFYGGDARFLTLYLEVVKGHDLSTKYLWRNATDNYFRGSEDNALQILIDIGSALKYLHGEGLEHNDIKPGNILFSEDRGAILCDFGISCLSNPSRQIDGGTPFYIPPEYMTLKKRGPPGDVYALGVVFLYLSKHLPLPEKCGLEITIANIHCSRDEEDEKVARTRMASWHRKIEATRARLKHLDSGTLTFWEMLSPKSRDRPSAEEIARVSSHELRRKGYRPQVKVKANDPVPGGKLRVESQKSVDHGSTTEENSIEWVLRSPT